MLNESGVLDCVPIVLTSALLRDSLATVLFYK